LLTLLFVMVCWVPFRSHNFGDTLVILKAMLGIDAGHYQWMPVWLFRCLGLCIMGHFAGWCIEKRVGVAQLGKTAPERVYHKLRMLLARLDASSAGRALAGLRDPLRLMEKVLGWLGIEIQSHELSGAWAVTQEVSLAGTYIVLLAFLVVLFFAPLNGNPFIYFQF